MLLHILKKEILQGFLNLRLSFTLFLVAGVVISGAILFTEDYEQQLADYDRNVRSNLQELSQRVDRCKTDGMWLLIYHSLSWYHQSVYRTPASLGFLAEGSEKELPNVLQVNPFFTQRLERKLRGNFLLWEFEDVDWVLIVSVILSFAAIVLTYDGISGERENGTLKLSMSNPLPRSTVILGKYLGAMVLLTIPLLIGMASGLLIVTTSGKINLTGEDWVRIAMVVLLSVLHLSAFVMLGLFVSSLFRSSAASLVVLLLSWVVMVVIIPSIGGIVATGLAELPTDETVGRDADAARNRAYDEYNARHPNASKLVSQKWWIYGQDLARAFASNDAFMRVYDRHWNQMIAQVQFGRNIARISPTGVYQCAAENIAGSGLNHCESFLKQVRQYRSTLRDFLLEHYPLDIHRSYSEDMDTLKEALLTSPFTAAEIPRFRDDPMLVEDSVTESMWDIAILFIYNIVFLMAASISFLHREIS